MNTPSYYFFDILVNPEHIDELRHVNNVIYLQWVQDAVAAHWASKAPASVRQQYYWVVLRHEIDYKAPAFLGEELIAKTWVHDYSGAKSTRIVQVIRKRDNKLLVEAHTLWCLMNNRPTRIGEDIKSIFLPDLIR